MKTKKRLLSILLSLVLMLGLMPGMALTAYAASYNITINDAPNGSVTASMNGSTVTSAEEGAPVTLTATPDAGYKLKSISATTKNVSETLNGSSNNSTVTGTYFKVSGVNLDDGGWRVGNPLSGSCTLTISSLSNKNISKVVLTVIDNKTQKNTSHLVTNHGNISATGTAPGSTVTVTDIDSPSVTLSAPEANTNAQVWIFSPIVIDESASIAPDLNDTENENVKTFTMSSSDVTITAEFEEAPKETYSLWIGGVQATSVNSSDLEGNKWSFTPNSGDTPATLTLNGYSYEGEGYDSSVFKSGIYYTGDAPLTVCFSGNNSITVNNGKCKGIYTNGKDVIFAGDAGASLTIYAQGKNNDNDCIYSYGIDASNINITGGTVTFKGGETYRGYDYGIINVSKISVTGGKLIAVGGNESWSTAFADNPASALPDSGIKIEAGSNQDGSDKAECTKNDLVNKKYVEITSSMAGSTTPAVTISPSADAGTVKAEEIKLYGHIDSWSLTATAAEGYKFVKWTFTYNGSAGQQFENPYNLPKDTIDQITGLTAVFEASNKESAIPATVAANNHTYDGTEKPLVTVTGEPTGGEMRYALGTATEATEQYTTSIPTATNAGT